MKYVKCAFVKIKFIIENWYLNFCETYKGSFILKYLIPIIMCIVGIVTACIMSETSWNIMVSIVAGVFLLN